MDFLSVIVAVVITGIFFVVVSMLIREVVELFKIEHNTFHKSSEIAGILSLLAFLQFFLAGIPILSTVMGLFMIVILYVLIKRFYGLSCGKAFLITLSILIVFLVLMILVSSLLLMMR